MNATELMDFLITQDDAIHKAWVEGDVTAWEVVSSYRVMCDPKSSPDTQQAAYTRLQQAANRFRSRQEAHS